VCLKAAVISSPAQPAAQADRQRRGCSLVFAIIGGAVVGRLASTLGLYLIYQYLALVKRSEMRLSSNVAIPRSMFLGLVCCATISMSACSSTTNGLDYVTMEPNGRFLVVSAFGQVNRQIELGNAADCRLVAYSMSKKSKGAFARDNLRCNAASSAKGLPYRASVRANETGTVFEFRALNESACKEAVKAMIGHSSKSLEVTEPCSV
jgi:hypothetical protein